MTDKVAFDLGKFDFPHFYQDVIWRINKEPFPYIHFFNWGLPCGTPCKNDYSTDWENFSLKGGLKTNMFTDISHKLAYIRGRLTSYSVNITENSISVCWANSHNLRDFFAKCLTEIVLDKFTYIKYELTKDNGLMMTPATPEINFISSKEVIDYIVKYNPY